MKLQFITAIPLNVTRGSGCFVGIRTLADGIRSLGTDVEMVTPRVHLPMFTAERIVFNEQLRGRPFDGSATIGFDLDGYRVSGNSARPHIAAIKGVLGDAVRFESGFTRSSMAFQAGLERLHARRADRVVTISRYCVERLEELYGVRDARVVPELIDLEAWEKRLARNPVQPDREAFTVLCVCRFYPRKRVDLLLRAVALLVRTIPELKVRIVGNGPEGGRLRRLSRELKIEGAVSWLGDATPDALAREYNRADVFCLPSVQEGFGIVFLEAMAAGKPIVAARAAAVPEVVPQGVLVEPENWEALAEGIATLYSDGVLRRCLAARGKELVQQYEMKLVAGKFLEAVGAPDPSKLGLKPKLQAEACST